MPISRTKSIVRGALVGALTSLPVMILSYIGQELANYTFLPFDLFSKMTGVYPGPLVKTGISTVARIVTMGQITPNVGINNNVEYGLSILIFVMIGMTFGAVLGMFSRVSNRYIRAIGWVGGLLLLGLFLSVETLPSPNTPSLMILFIGTTSLCLGWGWVMGQWAQIETVWVSNTPIDISISRRRFLIYLSATFLATVISFLGIAQYQQKQKGHIISTSAKPLKSH